MEEKRQYTDILFLLNRFYQNKQSLRLLTSFVIEKVSEVLSLLTLKKFLIKRNEISVWKVFMCFYCLRFAHVSIHFAIFFIILLYVYVCVSKYLIGEKKREKECTNEQKLSSK